MFSTLKSRILLGVYIFLILSIPIGAYLASETQIFKSRASEEEAKPVVTSTPRPTIAPSRVSELEDLVDELDSETTESASPTIATSFGPTLNLKIKIEGRPENDQSTKLFVGIAEGSSIPANPKYLLNFSVDVPESGIYEGLSLAGLSSGSTYTALLKGASQIATSSAFVMSPTITKLNNDSVLNLISGDLNDDNLVNSSDYSIVQKSYGATSSSSNWNELADLNLDGVINTFDLGIVSKNIDRSGDSGVWTSTPAGGLTSEATASGGYWIWLPK
ncbi:hypothetical protein A3C59_04265 [Candidatus Daviesbacteria bacterium RIFCSPHIGHO2_02_FULL_36_13]|uniref:Dockerin domain-containing protein n=1 Tax=Candidatus Daviesbacteria bacterium RIFCSPHIGHO2_02_FULL_36_13 TaxID=1797768 RepID=A0A1F5JRS2_9BACT|nr:MAG: hypothetical protein A3C59_04265 [Candidatus Daviesbacteria bacterium RIFCSPHIGHO2_02_FULL_36_13]OGE42411.1 MAG: hypothetical protein A3A45_01545 [Candidatus Daviesbacteria bacterium RIFCSPLOWO2_01_FULL_36_8]